MLQSSTDSVASTATCEGVMYECVLRCVLKCVLQCVLHCVLQCALQCVAVECRFRGERCHV